MSSVVSLILCLICAAACVELARCQTKNLYFSFTTAHSPGRYSALGAVPAVDLALQRINDDPDILPGYNLSYAMDVGNSLCDQTVSLDVFFSRLFNSSQPNYVAMMCCGCSVAAIPVAKISHHWNVPQMAYAAASLTLNNREMFRNFFRTMPVYTNMGIAVAELAETFNWRQLAVITESNGLFLPVLRSLEMVAKERNLLFHSHVLQSVSPFPSQDLFDWNEDYRMIYINAYAGVSRSIACEAYHRGLYGSRYVWITVNWGEGWWRPSSNVNCTEEQLIAVLDRGFTIIPRGFFIRNDKNTTTFSGITPGEYENLYAQRIESDEDYNYYSRNGLSYDAMWAIALGLNNTLTRILNNNSTGCEDVPGSIIPLEQFEYSNAKMGCLLRESFHQTSFSGVTGEIMFNNNGSRVNNIVTVRQYRRLGNSSLKMTVVGVVKVGETTANNTFEFESGETRKTLWPDGVPYDGSARDIVHPIALPLVIIYDVLASAGVLLAVACLVFNIVFRNKKVVKLSSPNLNYLIVLGTVLLFMSVYLYNYTAGGIDNAVLQTVVCNLRQWMSAIGYTLCFAVILSKTWRIYYIFNNPTRKKKTIHDWVLLLIVAIVVGVDVFIHLVGTAPPQIRIEANLTRDIQHPSNINGEGTIERNFVFICGDNAIVWLIISYAYKGLLQLVAMFMAFHIRKVKIKALNDSKEIAVIVYINSITLALLAVTEFALRQYHYAYVALYGTALLIGGYLFLGLMFGPKAVSLYRDPDGESVLKTSMPPPSGHTIAKKMPSQLNEQHQTTCTNSVDHDNHMEMTNHKMEEDVSTLRARVTQLEAKIAKMSNGQAQPQV